MKVKDHKERHKMLHGYLDELVADFITHTRGFPSKTTVLELMDWSAKQVDNPDPDSGQKEKKP